MGKLHECFENTITKIGFTHAELPGAFFNSASIGIRFEIGGKENVYLPDDKGLNLIYVKNAFYRAKTLFDGLPCRPVLLRIDNYLEEADRITLQTLSQVGLPAPDETIKEKRIDEGACFFQEHLYWDLAKNNCQIDKLLLEIIKGDIGGFSCLCSNVYFLNAKCAILYHLYDDRGVDIVANDKYSLLPLYQKYNEWILQYDKAKIDQLFAN